MSSFFAKQAAKKFGNTKLLNQLECIGCPLYNLPNKNKDIKPSGYDQEGGVYWLGLGPGETEDAKSEFFVGNAGTYLKSMFTQEQMKFVRMNNVTRTRHPDNTPPYEALESCRPSVEKDIAQYKPKGIFAYGGYPLKWAFHTDKDIAINAWRGHRFPINVAGHKTWMFPMLHPSGLLQDKRKDKNGVPHLDYLARLDIKHAYEFLERGLEPEVIDPKDAFANCHLLYKVDDIIAALLAFAKHDIFIDLETTPGRPYEDGARIWTMSFGTLEKAIAFPWYHPGHTWDPQDFKKLWTFLKVYLRNKKQRKGAHNASFEQEWLVAEFNDPLIAAANWFDTMSPAYSLGFGGNSKKAAGEDEEEKVFKGLLSLDNLVMVYFGFFLKSVTRNLDKTNLHKEPLKDVLIYNCGDTKWGDGVARKQRLDLEYEKTLTESVRQLDRRIPTLVLTQRKGMYINQSRVEFHSNNFESKLVDIYNEINKSQSVIEFRSKYGKFNIGAAEDVKNLLKVMGFNVTTKDNKEAADDEVLKAIDHPIARSILVYREVDKLKGTYLDSFLPGKGKHYYVYPDGLIHSQFSTHFTTSERTSSNKPNLQNVPKRKNKEIRDSFQAKEGHLICCVDFGQIQFRMFPIVTKDQKLIDAITNGLEIHGQWAMRIGEAYPKRIGGTEVLNTWKKDLDRLGSVDKLKDENKLFKAFRDIVKNGYVFPKFFGASDKSASVYMNIPINVSNELGALFWSEYPAVKKWQDDSYTFYKEHGYIEAPTGSRRYAPIEGGEIINYPIQHLEAAIVLDRFCALSEHALITGQDKFQPFNIVHDDLMFYLPKDSWEEDLRTCIRIMLGCKFPFINVPITVEASYGPDWYNQKTYGTFGSDKLSEI